LEGKPVDIRFKRQTLVEVAYEALKKDITEHVFIPGQKIILREMNERYGISETPIKQALNRLIAEGIVKAHPGRGSGFVRSTGKRLQN
jgi:DNA-binding GntR family transcriptional regulator